MLVIGTDATQAAVRSDKDGTASAERKLRSSVQHRERGRMTPAQIHLYRVADPITLGESGYSTGSEKKHD
jgi:hypothetical protein